MDGLSLKRKIIVIGKIRLESSLIIGSGQSDLADIEILKDDSGKPYIPSTSLCGVLRHYFEENFSDIINEQQSNYFWGKHMPYKNNEIESAFICHDLFTENSKINIRVRDGIKIDAKNGCAEDKGKYDYEVVEPGIHFNLFWEVSIRQKFDLITFRKILATLISKLERGELSLGAKTNNGFGKCILIDTKIFEFDFKRKEDVSQWLCQEFINGKKKLEEEPFIKKEESIFSIEAYFGIKSSFIVRSYPSDPKQPDAVHLSSNEKPILPGTSLKGAIRNRAFKIAKTLCISCAEEKIIELFGTAGKNEMHNKKSRVLVEETIIENAVSELQNRIQIDRFTGGTINSALFDSMPLWNSNNLNSVTIKLKINDFKQWEAGLLMLVLKDFWTDDLPIGGEKNVGRGILSGNMAIIRWNNKELKIEKDDGRLKFSSKTDADELNSFVKQLTEVK
ncbi:MAG: RAMP superfamily CRISPR-associated protein [Candidatus Methanoperedens sp.]